MAPINYRSDSLRKVISTPCQEQPETHTGHLRKNGHLATAGCTATDEI